MSKEIGFSSHSILDPFQEGMRAHLSQYEEYEFP